MDDDLIIEFTTEATEALAILDSEAVRLEKNPADREILDNIFRIIHTIKGTAGFLDFTRLGDIAHSTETLLDLMRTGAIEPSSATVTLILESLDKITEFVHYISQNGAEPEGKDTEFIARLEAHSNGEASEEIPVSNDKTNVKIDLTLPIDGLPTESDSTTIQSTAPQSIRVNIDVLENLMQMVGELVLNRNQLLQIVRTHDEVKQIIESPIQQLSNITSDLQESIIKTRMQPIGNAWTKFPRLIRDLSIDLDKKIELKMIGEEVELDRQLLEMVRDPLTHMLRNSCDHGLEIPDERLAAGKRETGTITLSAYHEGGYIIIKISDDGKGIELERVKEKILLNELATTDELEALTNRQIMQYIFSPGFSTAEIVTNVSGRGVGMDVVRNNIEKMGGMIDLESREGYGSTFSIKVPLTLAIIPAFIIEANHYKFAIPQFNILEIIMTGPNEDHQIKMIDDAPVLCLRDQILPLGILNDILFLEKSCSYRNITQEETQIIICNIGGNDFGLIVDDIHDTEEIVVKPVSERLEHISLYAGNTILGDGSATMILELSGISQEIGALRAGDQSNLMDAELPVLQKKEHLKYLIFRSGNNVNKAILLEKVLRLEEIETHLIEEVNGVFVTQYRNELMEMILIEPNATLPTEEFTDVIVLKHDQKNIAIIVDQIIDIESVEYDSSLEESTNEFSSKSVILNEVMTELINISTLIKRFNEKKSTSSRQGICLLFVEDSPFFQKLTLPLLESAGYHITIANNGAEALQIISHREVPFDGIITDLEMPVMNGIEFVKQCRALPTYQTRPILAYSSTLNESNVEALETAGISASIHKNDRSRLLESLEHYLTEQLNRENEFMV